MVKICVLRLSSLGDTVLITPVVKALKHRFPDSYISVVVKKEYTPVFWENPHVDELMALDVQGAHKGWSGLRRFTKGLREYECHLFVDLHRNLRSRWIRASCGAQKKISYNKGHWRRWALVHAKRVPLTSRHTVDLYLDALHSVGIESSHRLPEIFLKDEEIVVAENVLRKKGIPEGRACVGIHVGAKGEAKRWFPDRFAHIADMLHEEGRQPILFGGEGDQHFVHEVCRAMHLKPPVFLRPSLRRLMALIDRCCLFLCHDSGPMHIAVARKVPVVALFGPTHPNLGFWPLGERDVVVTGNVDCSPCSLHGTKPCRKKVKECMETISEDHVYEVILRSLRGPLERSHVRA